jgi:hypothetical protein
MDRRKLVAGGLGAALVGGAGRALAQAQDQGSYGQGGYGPPPPPQGQPYDQGYPPPPAQAQQPPVYPYSGYPPASPPPRAETYSDDEIVHNVSDFFGVASEKAGAVVEHVFRDNGRPTAYIAGEEASGAIGLGLRYGDGLLYMKHRPPMKLYWRGPSVGWDIGGNASRVFTLCYNLQYPEAVLQRFPGVDGSIYVVAGLGVNYQRADDITLAPIRSGVGLRLGANVGYLAYSRSSHWLPF